MQTESHANLGTTSLAKARPKGELKNHSDAILRIWKKLEVGGLTLVLVLLVSSPILVLIPTHHYPRRYQPPLILPLPRLIRAGACGASAGLSV